MTFDPQQAIRRAAMVARGLSNTVGPIPNAPGPALPQFDPKTFPGIHVKVAPHPNDRVKLQTGGTPGDMQPADETGFDAWHGTPHDFPAERLVQHPTGEQEHVVGAPDKLPDVPEGAQVLKDYPNGRFRDAAIGSGEGAQAFGQGHYSAEYQKLAQNYRDALAKGKTSFDDYIDTAGQRYEHGPLWQRTYNAIKKVGGTSQSNQREIARHLMDALEKKDIKNSTQYPNKFNINEKFKPHYEAAINSLNDISYDPRPINKGKLLHLRINANPNHFLDWDKPLSEQHPIVQNVAHHADITHLKPGNRSRVLLERFRNNEENPDYKMTGSNLLTALNNDEYHSVATAKLLQKAGIPGIRYLDAASRDPNTNKPTSNYVVFDPDKIDIKHKYERGGEVERTGKAGGGSSIQSKEISPEDRLMVIHNTRLDRLQKADKLGGLPVPSIAIAKPEHGFNGFGDVSLIGHPHMAKPSKENPIFASDVYSPRFPPLSDDETKIFNGYTANGNRKYAHLTLDNVVKKMKGNIRNGEGWNYGAGSIRATVTPQFKKIEDLKNSRNKIIHENEFNPIKEKTNIDLFNLADKFHPYSKYSGSSIAHSHDFMGMLADSAKGGMNEISTHYNNLPPELLNEVRSHINNLKNMPTTYFEAKPQRGVGLHEFAGAVVPHDQMETTAPILQKHGITRIEPYKANDEKSRIEALKKFSDMTFKRGGEVEKTNTSKQPVNKNTNSLTHSIQNAVNLAKSITPGRR